MTKAVTPQGPNSTLGEYSAMTCINTESEVFWGLGITSTTNTTTKFNVSWQSFAQDGATAMELTQESINGIPQFLKWPLWYHVDKWGILAVDWQSLDATEVWIYTSNATIEWGSGNIVSRNVSMSDSVTVTSAAVWGSNHNNKDYQSLVRIKNTITWNCLAQIQLKLRDPHKNRTYDCGGSSVAFGGFYAIDSEPFTYVMQTAGYDFQQLRVVSQSGGITAKIFDNTTGKVYVDYDKQRTTPNTQPITFEIPGSWKSKSLAIAVKPTMPKPTTPKYWAHVVKIGPYVTPPPSPSAPPPTPPTPSWLHSNLWVIPVGSVALVAVIAVAGVVRSQLIKRRQFQYEPIN
eukprot:TRINITY_DN86199_c0_g1_i1.p1 TRINITY_DN86199_c0_g1~~TRINITY_DN86199_c0_g1_i1.p1  ORF type:complete len:346 (+),score=30.90 TRINITY_DN86199_c0_g1_i1:535-1572(+)